MGNYIQIDMNKYEGSINNYNRINFLVYWLRNYYRYRSIYTINLQTLNPTFKSPIQLLLSNELKNNLSLKKDIIPINANVDDILYLALL